MFSSEAISRNNMNINSNNTMAFSTGNYKSGMEGEFLKSKEMMVSSDNLLQQQQNNGGLTRYRSAPSTFFASFLDAANSDSSHGEDEAENMLSAFMEVQDLNETASPHHHHQLQFPSNLKQERMDYGQQNNGFTNSNPQVVYEAPLIINNGSNGALLENQIQSKMNGNGSNNLIRQSSSPAGFFNGFDITRESNSNGLNNHQMNFTSRGGATSRIFMPSIAENVNENTAGNPENQHIYVNASWNDSTSSNPLKRNRDSSTFNGLNNQNNPGLSHHLSLPKTSAEMAVIENYLQFEQNNNVVPCKLRAKRGCATHPRSVAERVRRTRISDRMKKLQELFPNMDKQTNTAEMLDLAVDYIKDLQKQVQTLTEVKAKCTC